MEGQRRIANGDAVAIAQALGVPRKDIVLAFQSRFGRERWLAPSTQQTLEALAREGVRMGLWGAAQAIAFGSGGFVGTAASDLMRYLLVSPALAYAVVFAVEGLLFLVAALLALRVGTAGPSPALAGVAAPRRS